jgi:Na+-transporting NADH:ubiquinone oxidoreductase subunit F
MKGQRIISIIHRWTGLLVGLQLFIWVATGLYFNVVGHQKATGSELRIALDQSSNILTETLAPITTLPLASSELETVRSISLIWLLEHPYYKVVFAQGAHNYQAKDIRLFDAITGLARPFDAQQAFAVAQSSYAGTSKLSTPILLNLPIDDLPKQQSSVWQVRVNDSKNTVIYVDALTGDIIKHVNDDTRLDALMMKLHFMDYGNSGEFNHPLIILFALFALIQGVTGVYWLINLYKRGNLNLKPRKQPFLR